MYMHFSEDDFESKNEKFESFRKAPTKINSLLSEYFSLVQVISDCLHYYWKAQPHLHQSHSINKRDLNNGGFLQQPAVESSFTRWTYLFENTGTEFYFANWAKSNMILFEI